MPDTIHADMPRYRVAPNGNFSGPGENTDIGTSENVIKKVQALVKQGVNPEKIQVGEWDQGKKEYRNFVSLTNLPKEFSDLLAGNEDIFSDFMEIIVEVEQKQEVENAFEIIESDNDPKDKIIELNNLIDADMANRFSDEQSRALFEELKVVHDGLNDKDDDYYVLLRSLHALAGLLKRNLPEFMNAFEMVTRPEGVTLDNLIRMILSYADEFKKTEDYTQGTIGSKLIKTPRGGANFILEKAEISKTSDCIVKLLQLHSGELNRFAWKNKTIFKELEEACDSVIFAIANNSQKDHLAKETLASFFKAKQYFNR